METIYRGWCNKCDRQTLGCESEFAYIEDNTHDIVFISLCSERKHAVFTKKYIIKKGEKKLLKLPPIKLKKRKKVEGPYSERIWR